MISASLRYNLNPSNPWFLYHKIPRVIVSLIALDKEENEQSSEWLLMVVFFSTASDKNLLGSGERDLSRMNQQQKVDFVNIYSINFIKDLL